MNKKFLSAILFGALMVSSTGTFVSCKDYDDDIDNINKELTEVKSQIAALQTKIDAGKWITNVTPATGGFTVAFSDGSSYTITNGKDGNDGVAGEAGAPGTQWIISEDGFWVCDGEKTTVKAVGQDGVKGEDGKDAQPEVKKENGKWYLWNGTEFEEITVEAPATANVPYYYIDPADNNYAVMVICDKDGKNEKEIRLPLNECLAQLAVLNETRDLAVYYSIATNAKDLQAWEGPKGAPAKGSYMITTSADSLMVQVTPTNYDLSGDELQLVNSKNEVAPVTLGKAVAYNGLYTRAASVNGMFKIPFSIETITAEIVKAYPNTYGKRPALSLVASDKVRSTYETTLAIQKETNTVDFGSFYVNKKQLSESSWTTNNIIELGKTGTLKDSNNADKLYDAFLTVKDGYEADSIKYGIKTDGLTISCNESAKDHGIRFIVHTLDVAGNVKHNTYAYVSFGEESTTSTVEFETQKHTATGDVAKQNLLVDFAPYFKDMSTADRILWNADASMRLYNTNVDWVYTDEATGREIKEEDKFGLITSIQMAKTDGTVAADKADFAKLLITFNTNYSNFKFKGTYTAKVTVNYNNNIETISIPFEIASPIDTELAKQYAYNPAYYNATSKVFTVPSASTTGVDLSTLISGNIDYTGAKAADADKTKLTVNGKHVQLANPEDLNKAYTVEGLKLSYLGNEFDIPAIKVQFIEYKNYKFSTTNTLTFQSGKATSDAKVLYGKTPDKTKDAYYNLTTILGDNVAAADVTINGIEFTSPLATEDGSELLTASVDASTKNIVLNFTGKKTTEDSTVAIKVTATVNGEEIEGTVTVKIKKYPTE